MANFREYLSGLPRRPGFGPGLLVFAAFAGSMYLKAGLFAVVASMACGAALGVAVGFPAWLRSAKHHAAEATAEVHPSEPNSNVKPSGPTQV